MRADLRKYCISRSSMPSACHSQGRTGGKWDRYEDTWPGLARCPRAVLDCGRRAVRARRGTPAWASSMQRSGFRFAAVSSREVDVDRSLAGAPGAVGSDFGLQSTSGGRPPKRGVADFLTGQGLQRTSRAGPAMLGTTSRWRFSSTDRAISSARGRSRRDQRGPARSDSGPWIVCR